jgi:hypothetical protein
VDCLFNTTIVLFAKPGSEHSPFHWLRLLFWLNSQFGAQAQDELCAMVVMIVQDQVAIEDFCYFFANIEAQTMAHLIDTTTLGILSFEVGLKQIRSIFQTDSDALVCYFNSNFDLFGLNFRNVILN